MPRRIGIPRVGRARFARSGLLLSTPGVISHEITPQKRLSQLTILMRATRLATSHSPVGSVAESVIGPAGAAANANSDIAITHTVNAAANCQAANLLELARCGTVFALRKLQDTAPNKPTIHVWPFGVRGHRLPLKK